MAKLPKSTHPVFKISIPSTGNTHNFRQFLVREEKLLLTANQSGAPEDITDAVAQIITNCALDDDFSVDDLTTFDFDYLFIRLRAISINNIITIKITPENAEPQELVIDLDKIKVIIPDINRTIVTSSGNTIKLRYPRMKDVLKIIEDMKEDPSVNYLDRLLLASVDSIYNNEEVFEFDNDELLEFYNNQTHDTFVQIREFLTNIPDITHTVHYKTKEGDASFVLKGIKDFFTWR